MLFFVRSIINDTWTMEGEMKKVFLAVGAISMLFAVSSCDLFKGALGNAANFFPLEDGSSQTYSVDLSFWDSTGINEDDSMALTADVTMTVAGESDVEGVPGMRWQVSSAEMTEAGSSYSQEDFDEFNNIAQGFYMYVSNDLGVRVHGVSGDFTSVYEDTYNNEVDTENVDFSLLYSNGLELLPPELVEGAESRFTHSLIDDEVVTDSSSGDVVKTSTYTTSVDITLTVASVDDSVTVPAGTFDSVIRVDGVFTYLYSSVRDHKTDDSQDSSNTSEYTYEGSIYFAEGIGIVKADFSNSNGMSADDRSYGPKSWTLELK